MSAYRDIEDRAAQWLIQRDEAEWSKGDQAELDNWLDQSCAHKAAFWRLEHGWREADRIRSLGVIARGVNLDGRGKFAAAWKPAVLAASLLLALTIVMRFVPLPTSGPAAKSSTIATSVGDHKLVALDDGSRIELNTATVVRAAVTPYRREVWLDKGEVFFEIHHSKEHPFVVYAGSRTITVLGTKFSVRREGEKVVVSVLEGRVRIDHTNGKVHEVSSSTVTTGDVAIAEGPSILVAAKPADQVKAALSWREGMLNFDQQTLAGVAAEFNRYNKIQLLIADPAVAEIRIGGTFQASNVEAFTRLLAEAYNLRVTREAGVVKISG